LTEDFDENRDWEAEELELLRIRQDEHFELEQSREVWTDANTPIFVQDLVNSRISLPARLFEDFLFSRSLCMVSGEPHSGKSMFLLAMLASLDLESPLFGVFAPSKNRPVLFLGQDSPPWDYQYQLSRLSRGMAGEPGELAMRSMCLFNKGFDLLHPSFWPWLVETTKLWGTKVLMIDTLLEHHNQNENDNGQMKLVMGILKAARDKLNLTVIFSHHTAKPFAGATVSANYRARGASCIVGSVDQHILIRGFKGGMKITAPKLRGGDIKLESLNLSFEPGMIGSSPSICLVPSENPYKGFSDTVLAFVLAPRSRREIQEHLKSVYPTWTNPQLVGRTSSTLRYLVLSDKLVHLERSLYGPKGV